MSRVVHSQRIPSEILATLAGLQRRARFLALAKGLAAVVITVVLAAMAAMAVDRFIVIYDWRIRMGSSVAILGAAVVILIRSVWMPIRRQFSASGLAMTAEDAYPDLEERLSSVVELLASSEPESIKGSAVMVDELTRQACTEVARVSVGKVISLRRGAWLWAGVGALAAICAALAVQWPAESSLLLRRLVTPNAKRAFLTGVTVESIGPVPLGEPVQIIATVERRAARNCDLILRNDGHEQRIAMSRTEVADAATNTVVETYAHTIPAARDGLEFQVRANDGYSEWHTLRAVARPHIRQITLSFDPPAYSGESPHIEPAAAGRIECLAQTEVTVEVHTNKPVSDAALEFDRDTRVPLESIDETTYRARFRPVRDGVYRIRLTDAFGFANLDAGDHEIRVRPDRPPAVRIVSPARRITVRPDETIPVRFIAADDFELAGAELHIEVETTPLPIAPIKLPAGSSRQAETTMQIDLAALGIEGITQVRYRVRVSDSLPVEFDGPQYATTATHVIMLDANAEPLALQVLRSLREALRAAIDEMDRNLSEAEIRTADLKQEAEADEPFNLAARQSAAEARARLRRSRTLAHNAAQNLRETNYAALGEILTEEIAKPHLAPAEQHVAEAVLHAEDVEQRRDHFAQAEQAIVEARKQLGQLSKRLDALSKYEDAAHQLAEAAARQAELAEKLKNALGDETLADALKQLSPEQRELLQVAQQIMKDNAALKAEALKQQQAAQETLMQQLDQLAAREGELRDATLGEHARREARRQLAELADPRQAVANIERDWSDPLARLARRQKTIAEQAATLAKALTVPADPSDDATTAPEPNPTAQAAATEAERAAQDLERIARGATTVKQSGPRTLEHQAASIDRLTQLAGQLLQPNQETGADAATEATRAYRRSQHATQAGRLADRQRHLASELAAILADKPNEALAARQMGLQFETERVADVVDLVAEQVAGLDAELGKLAEQARQRVGEEAPAAQSAATRQARADQLPEAGEQMARAREALQQASSELATLGKRLAKAADENKPGDETASGLADALTDAMREQAESLQAMSNAQSESGAPSQAQSSASQAQSAAAKAAASLGMTAQQFMAAANSLGSAGQVATRSSMAAQASQGRGSLGVKMPDPRHLNLDLLGVTRSQWARLPGHLRDEVIQAADDQAPAEYRELIQQYFRHISQQGAIDLINTGAASGN